VNRPFGFAQDKEAYLDQQMRYEVPDARHEIDGEE